MGQISPPFRRGTALAGGWWLDKLLPVAELVEATGETFFIHSKTGTTSSAPKALLLLLCLREDRQGGEFVLRMFWQYDD